MWSNTQQAYAGPDNGAGAQTYPPGPALGSEPYCSAQHGDPGVSLLDAGWKLLTTSEERTRWLLLIAISTDTASGQNALPSQTTAGGNDQRGRRYLRQQPLALNGSRQQWNFGRAERKHPRYTGKAKSVWNFWDRRLSGDRAAADFRPWPNDLNGSTLDWQ